MFCGQSNTGAERARLVHLWPLKTSHLKQCLLPLLAKRPIFSLISSFTFFFTMVFSCTKYCLTRSQLSSAWLIGLDQLSSAPQRTAALAQQPSDVPCRALPCGAVLCGAVTVSCCVVLRALLYLLFRTARYHSKCHTRYGYYYTSFVRATFNTVESQKMRSQLSSAQL